MKKLIVVQRKHEEVHSSLGIMDPSIYNKSFGIRIEICIILISDKKNTMLAKHCLIFVSIQLETFDCNLLSAKSCFKFSRHFFFFLMNHIARQDRVINQSEKHRRRLFDNTARKKTIQNGGGEKEKKINIIDGGITLLVMTRCVAT